MAALFVEEALGEISNLPQAVAKALFATRIAGMLVGGVRVNYAVTRDGKRFLIVTETDEAPADDRRVVVNGNADRGIRDGLPRDSTVR